MHGAFRLIFVIVLEGVFVQIREIKEFGQGHIKGQSNFVQRSHPGVLGKTTHDIIQGGLVGLILEIARNLKVPVVAEGVETEEQLELLRNLGCAYVQGFFFTRPLPPEVFEKQAFGA